MLTVNCFTKCYLLSISIVLKYYLICLFVGWYGFFCPIREFFTHNCRWRAADFAFARHLRPLSSEGYFAWYTYCDTGHPSIMVISEDPLHTSFAERLVVELSLPVLRHWSVWACLERSPSMRKARCSNPSRDSPVSWKQVMTTPLPNVRQQVWVSQVHRDYH